MSAPVGKSTPRICWSSSSKSHAPFSAPHPPFLKRAGVVCQRRFGPRGFIGRHLAARQGGRRLPDLKMVPRSNALPGACRSESTRGYSSSTLARAFGKSPERQHAAQEQIDPRWQRDDLNWIGSDRKRLPCTLENRVQLGSIRIAQDKTPNSRRDRSAVDDGQECVGCVEQAFTGQRKIDCTGKQWRRRGRRRWRLRKIYTVRHEVQHGRVTERGGVKRERKGAATIVIKQCQTAALCRYHETVYIDGSRCDQKAP